MIADLSMAAVREVARQAARSQATPPAKRQPRTVPLAGEDQGTSWTLDAVLAHIDRADVVRWDTADAQDVLVVVVRGDYIRRFALQRPPVALVADETQEFRAETQAQNWVPDPTPAPSWSAKSAWSAQMAQAARAAMVCDPCELPAAGRQPRLYAAPEAEHLAAVHDQLHHAGGRTARAVAMTLVRVGDWCLPAEQLQQMREWAVDCPWREIEADDFLDPDLVPDHVVVAGVERYYQGSAAAGAAAVDGVAGFLADAGLRAGLVHALQVRAGTPWEVDDTTGHPIYLGRDVVLAAELAHLDPGSHLIDLSEVPA